AREFNAAIANLPYQDFSQGQQNAKENDLVKTRDESFYRSLLLMLLRGCGLQAKGEMPTCRGRSDVVITMPERILVIEFKLAKNAQDIAKKLRQGEEQIIAQGYLEPYTTGKIPVSSAVFVVDAQKRQIVIEKGRQRSAS
ncbi:MAG: PD-(D/E)XK nuclease domain-containing protein, partial [Desulfovibrio sp.]|nr:PD-(D/E)XK nuclease domain-containing protein [Desulfovibrio sp.]